MTYLTPTITAKETMSQFLTASLNHLVEPTEAVIEIANEILRSTDASLNEFLLTDLRAIKTGGEAFLGQIQDLLQQSEEQVLDRVETTVLASRIIEHPTQTQMLDMDLSQAPSLAHELRNPINSIIGFSRVILKGIDGPITEFQRIRLDAIQQKGRYLLSLTNNIFDAFRVEAHKSGPYKFYMIQKGPFKTCFEDFLQKLPKTSSPLVNIVPENIPETPVNIDSNRIAHVLSTTTTVLSQHLPDEAFELDIVPQANHINITLTHSQSTLNSDILSEFDRIGPDGSLFACHRFDSALDLCLNRSIIESHGGTMQLSQDSETGLVATFTLPTCQ